MKYKIVLTDPSDDYPPLQRSCMYGDFESAKDGARIMINKAGPNSFVDLYELREVRVGTFRKVKDKEIIMA